jgi:hypothetical protein
MTAFRTLTLLAGLLGAATVDAATFCVATESALVNALSTAEDNGVDDEIRIRSGLIVYQGQQINAFRNTMNGNESLSVSGGWSGSSGQCTTQTANPALTVLDGNDVARVMEIQRPTSSSGSLTLRNLTLRRGRNPEYGACLLLQAADSTVDGENLIENLIVNGCTNGIGAGIAIVSRLGTTTLRNVLLRDNQSTSVSALYLFAQGTTYVSNLTVTDNVTTTPNNAVLLQTSQAGAIFVSNSVFWNNVGGGSARGEIELDGGNVTLVRNLYGTISGDPPTVLSNNNLRVDPRFATDGIRLRPSSPARDAGTNSPLGGASAVDLDGRPRVQGARMDLGAYEIPVIFDDGFE